MYTLKPLFVCPSSGSRSTAVGVLENPGSLRTRWLWLRPLTRGAIHLVYLDIVPRESPPIRSTMRFIKGRMRVPVVIIFSVFICVLKSSKLNIPKNLSFFIRSNYGAKPWFYNFTTFKLAVFQYQGFLLCT